MSAEDEPHPAPVRTILSSGVDLGTPPRSRLHTALRLLEMIAFVSPTRRPDPLPGGGAPCALRTWGVFTARLATSRARLAELRGVACSFAVEDLHLLPKHQLAWRTPFDATNERPRPDRHRLRRRPPRGTTRACCSPPRSLAGSASVHWRTPTSTSVTADPGRLGARGRRLHRRRRCLARRRDGERAGLHGQGAVHPRCLPAQLPLGATSASSPASAAHCSPAPGRPERDPARRRSRSTSTRRSVRPTASPRVTSRKLVSQCTILINC